MTCLMNKVLLRTSLLKHFKLELNTIGSHSCRSYKAKLETVCNAPGASLQRAQDPFVRVIRSREDVEHDDPYNSPSLHRPIIFSPPNEINSSGPALSFRRLL
jgi:hypothetical protein